MSAPNPLDKVRVVFAWTALGMWAMSWALDAFAQMAGLAYTTPDSIPAIAIGISALMFGSAKFTRGDNDK